MFDDFFGNRAAVEALLQMIERERIPQTILLAGPEGIGKATLVRRFAARLLPQAGPIEQDDLSLPHNAGLIAEREKWPGERRVEAPLLFASHPDFLTFPPDGPLRQISIQQMRALKDRAPFRPMAGGRRVFLIDQVDRANEQAANSLLKTLEEPPEHLVLMLTAQNHYDLLPTIRSRAVPLHLARLSDDQMRAFALSRRLPDADRRLALAAGCPGLAVSVDLAAYELRREAMLALLESASGQTSFGDWARQSERVASARSEKLETYLQVLCVLLEDLLHLREGVAELRNPDIRARLEPLARRVSFHWLKTAADRTNELAGLLRRNIQKNIALDALVLELRAGS